MTVDALDAQQAVTPNAANQIFWRYWTASTVSTWGTSVTAVAMPIIALTMLHASAFEVSLLPAASFAAWLLIGLPAGALVKRYPLRATQVSMDAARAIAIASIPVAYALSVLTMAQLVAVTLLLSFADVIFSVGNSTFLPRIVPKAELTRRNSIFSGTNSVSQFGAPALAGLLVAAVGPVVSLVVDAVSYVLSSVILQTLPNPGMQPNKTRGPIVQEIKEGISFVWRHPVMRPCVTAATAINFGCGALMALLPIFVIRGVGASPALVGPVLATEGIGSLLGAMLVGRLVKRFGSARVGLVGVSIAAVGGILLPLAHGPAALYLFGLGNLVCALGVVMFSVVTRTQRQADSPPEILSRVMGTVRFVSWGAVPFGAMAGGLLNTWSTMTASLSLIAASMLLSVVIVLASPVRGRRSLESV
ncbi:MFS transporter [Catellatospora tritici]|uniref:MFS transporter n=1 Tax=Catellatospora tritici TaxID=2851566 RepID=UPI001C2CE51D|nr:MFS transporter [Catellatospora tritici]MBV1849992.1 MFS transporter [Catellatospora tritici]